MKTRTNTVLLLVRIEAKQSSSSWFSAKLQGIQDKDRKAERSHPFTVKSEEKGDGGEAWRRRCEADWPGQGGRVGSNYQCRHYYHRHVQELHLGSQKRFILVSF
ncbi:hypothetical protein VULLAG_LOCUS145 [Vulpes lagopus]